MSDNKEDLVKQYEEDVYPTQPRSIGLFPIPEYPELESERGMWAAALDALLTTLRYLAPGTLLTLFWGQQGFFSTLIKYIDNAFRAIAFSSEEQKQEVLQWLAKSGPMTVEHLETVWRHGWILCSVLDEALPGACAGHPPTRLSLQHAQALADHYLGVEPVFSRQELESNESLSRHQEWKLATYLDRIRQALSKITPSASKPTSQRTSPETTQFTFDYVAKGSGLKAAQINHKMSFKVYPTSQQALDPGEVTILIKGPKDTYGMTVLPPILGKPQKIRQKLLGMHSKQAFTENALPITQGATYLRAFGKNDMNKTYFIPKTKYDIEIEVEKRLDHAKIWYKVMREGKYEILITSRGLCIVGSPFAITASQNIVGILEKEHLCLENGEEIDIVDVKTDRKVVLRIVDFVTEKMLLRENGTLEKISEAEAKILMTTDLENERSCSVTEIDDHNYKSNKFNEVAQRILKMNRVCRVFNDLMEVKREQSVQKQKEKEKEKSFICKRNQNDIPDIVNSTLCDSAINPFVLSEDRYIVPENISVSIRTEKTHPFNTEGVTRQADEIKVITPNEQVFTRSTSPDSLEEKISADEIEDDILSVDRLTPISSTNPFLSEVDEDFEVEKKMGTFVKSEYETNNSQNEETRDSTVKIIVDNNTPSPIETNPFVVPDIRLLDRPKTPVYKIITGELSNRADSPYLDPKNGLLTDDMLSNEFVNPFFVHQLQSTSHYDKLPITDFIIGAPVSLPPTLRAPSPKPDNMPCEIKAEEEDNAREVYHCGNITKEEDISTSVFSTPLHSKVDKPNNQSTLLSSTFHSLDSDLTDTIDISTASTSSENQFEPIRNNREFSPRKDIWDSAYVSIDENNSSSPDSNNNENNNNSEVLSKQKFSHNDETCRIREEELLNMGPAERELWTTCAALNETNKTHEEVKPYRWDIKRPMFTPIIEESDRSISSGIKDISLRSNEADSVTVAFAEINDIYQEYFPNSEKGSSITSEDDLQRTELDQTIETNDTGVESASETLSDVMRHKKGHEGKISEVQADVTESVSVSQTLHSKTDGQSDIKHNVDETQFGDRTYNNIVLEKKKYWDEKIRMIEAKTEESTKHLKKRRIPAKQLKHDSLSKRKGKQIIKNFLNAGEQQTKLTRQNSLSKTEEAQTFVTDETQLKAEAKLVDKWRRFWDEKLDLEHEDVANILPASKVQIEINKTAEDTHKTREESLKLPTKQELPDEEVFKAFETSPKRFFGTSRKRILNKIDTFLGKPMTAEENPTIEQNEVSHDSGLVSSRISLFHSMSNTEPLPETRNTTISIHNIYMRKDSETDIILTERPDKEEIKQQNDKPENLLMKTTAESTLKTDLTTKAMQDKRARMTHRSFNTSFDEVVKTSDERFDSSNTQVNLKPIREFRPSHIDKYKKSPVALRKTCFSKSEMDIFSKVPIEADDGLDKHKSYDELPKINVKSFISLYENVSKTSVESRSVKRIYSPSSVDSQTFSPPISLTSDTEKKRDYNKLETKTIFNTITPETTPTKQTQHYKTRLSSETTSIESVDVNTDYESISTQDTSPNKESTYISLSDIELEIVESSPDKSSESSPERTGQPHIDYKNRFNKAKQYFQSLEELREIKKPKKLNECQLLLLNKSTESLENKRPQKRIKKKSHSMPSTEIAKYWNEMQEKEKQPETKLVKISEKFHVDDLFSDVMEGKLSRQGSLRGIPHKKAVLEAFRSMENISDGKISPYDMSTSQITDFTSENRVTSAQTYLNEYPYLPTTDPSKYHSRLDAKASGLITLKELLEKKHRRNSVPDLRLLPKFSADL